MKPLFLFIFLACFNINQAFAQTPNDVVSSFFQSFDQQTATVATGALQKTSIKPKPSRELTPILMFAKANWDTLSTDTQSLVNPWLARPDDSVGTPPSGVNFFGATQNISTITTANFIFHYLDATAYPSDANRATTTFVNQLATEAEVVWAKIVTTMGYNAPPADAGKGGSNKYDIYLINTGGVGIYGYVTSDAQFYLGTPYPRSLYSHMVIDNDFAGFPQAPIEAAKVTLAHEFFHSIQYGYDPTEFSAFLESSATWMEDKVYPTIKDNLQYIGEVYVDANGDGQYNSGESFTDRNSNGLRESGSQDYPELHLDSFGLSQNGNGLEQYGRFMWLRYLSDKHTTNTTNGDALIKDILTNTGVTGGNNTYAAIDAALQNIGSSLADAFHEFGIWNIDTSKYTNGADYPIAWGDKLFTSGAVNFSSNASPSLRCFPKKQKHLSTIYELVNNPNATYTFTSSGSAQLSAMIQSTVSGAYTVQSIPLTGGQGSWAAPANTSKVTFVISNVSPTDDTMTWQLTDGVTDPSPQSSTVGCPGINPPPARTSRPSCLSSVVSPYLLGWLGLLLIPVFRRKK